MGFMEKLFNKMDYPQELRVKTKIAQWAMFHGLASIAIMNGPEEIHEWEENAPDILSKNYLIVG